MTSFAYIFTMEKGPNQDYFLPFSYLSTDFHFLWYFLRPLGCKRLKRSHFAGGAKRQFQEDGVRGVNAQMFYF